MPETKKLRFEGKNVCEECKRHSATCGLGTACSPVRKRLRRYSGIRLTSDGFDCALPLSIDSHSHCSFSCRYCFSPNLVQRREESKMDVGQTSLTEVEQLFSGKSKSKTHKIFMKALKYDDRNRKGYPCPVQLGALTDPLDNIERNQGWFLKFAELVKKYNQPVRISTKGNLFLEDEYLDAVADRPELFWVNFSIISPDDKVLKQVDKRAPAASERIECMRRLSEVGVKTGLRFRPIIPGISDATDDYPHDAWKTLIEMAAEAGAKAISYEVAFLPGMMTAEMRKRWEEVERISGKPLIKIYRSFGRPQACTRSGYRWTEDIMHKIHDEAKKHNMDIGVSDPVWKQLSKCGCCCGIRKDDPVFGNWQRQSATNRLIEAKKSGKPITLKDITPTWADSVPISMMVNTGVGPKAAYSKRHGTWADKLREIWNNPASERGPLSYFQGALRPLKRDKKGDLTYRYVGLKRFKTKRKTPFWNC